MRLSRVSKSFLLKDGKFERVVFMDAIHYKVKQDGAIVNKAAYMVIGIDLDGNKDVLGMWIGENESSKFSCS